MANKEIHYMSKNGTMFWPATTTTAIIDPTSQEILSNILNKKVSVGNAGNISSTVLPPIILESIATVSTNLTINATLIGKTYFCPDLEKIRHFYALEVNQSFQTTPEDTDPSPELIYYDKGTDKFYRWNAVNQEMIGVVTGGDNNIQEITWSALKTLRDGGNLTPGQLYRITDYTCTTIQTDTQSAGHLFDIIVLALSGSTLSETAWADHHEGDTYFSNCRLEAWGLKYCLDNDTTRFMWADTTNGKGVIYWMKDEWGNECPYDFKNIQFKRWAIDDIKAPSGSRVNSEGLVKLNDTFAVGNGHSINCSYRSGDYTISNLLSIETGGGSLFYYTFQHIRKSGGAYNYYDLSISKDTLDSSVLDFYIDDGTGVNIQSSCRHNVIEKTTYKNDSEGITITYPEKQVLNNIVFIGYSDYDDYDDNYCTTIECSNNIIKEGGYDITILFGSECRCNQFGTGCNSNLLGKNLTTFNKNIFGDGCYNNVLVASNTNTFGHDSGLNVFIGENYHNIFGDSYRNNVLGGGCAYNTFGVMCHDNTFGNNCINNVLGNYCHNNTFGNSCSNNVFGDNCYNNTFIYNSSSYNKIGSGCSYITRAGTNPITQLRNCEIGEGCSNIVFSPSYFKNITIEQGIKYLQMSPGGGTTSSDIYQNYRFCSGIEGTSSNWKFIFLPSANNNFLTTYKPANSVEISV